MISRPNFHNRLTNRFLLLFVILVLIRCANPVTPEGGPKDTTPPALIKSVPPLYMRNFNASKVKIYFSEFIQLKDLNKELIISPPMQKMPDIKAKGKVLQIEFNEALKENTTYNLFFGNAIVDLTENNPLTNFQYIFSTGDVLDSLSIKGTVVSAFDLTPSKGINVMLYLDNNDTVPLDSMPYVVRPYFMTKTNENGEYILNNLPDKSYKLFALEDANGNLLFDQPTEKIAFIDTLVTPYYIPLPLSDSLVSDSLAGEENTDAVHELKLYNLSLFEETDTVQRFLKALLVKKDEIMVILKLPTINPEVIPLNLPLNYDWSLQEINKTKDTLTFWLKNIDQDSLKLKISDVNFVADTIDLAIVKKSRGRKSKEPDTESHKLAINFNFHGTADLDQPLKLTFGYPVTRYDVSRILLVEKEDTMQPLFSFTDEIKRAGLFDYRLKPATAYEVIIPDSVFFDIHGWSHDSVTLKFTTKALEDIGNFYLETTVSDTSFNYIFQLLDKDKVIRQEIINTGQKLSFKYLNPGTFKLKVIYDKNRNRKWDSGSYYKHIQPEEVKFFQKDITIRANWDVEESWDLSN